MAKDRIDPAELADKLVEQVKEAEDPIRAMAQLMADSLMDSEVTAKVGAEPHERSACRTARFELVSISPGGSDAGRTAANPSEYSTGSGVWFGRNPAMMLRSQEDGGSKLPRAKNRAPGRLRFAEDSSGDAQPPLGKAGADALPG